MNLSAVDVNLVVALDALLRERNVTRAARRMGLSQPAMSHALMRLRDVLGDPLLVRVGRQMALTPRAESLTGPVAAVMHALAGLFGSPPPPFDHATSTRTFRIAATDYAQLVLIAQLNSLIVHQAPRAALHVVPLGTDAAAFDALRHGKLDLVIGVFAAADLPPDVRRAEIILDRFVGLARLNHPTARGRVDIATYASFSHVLVSGRGLRDGVIDEVLAQQGVARRVATTVPHIVLTPHIVAGSDLVAIVAERIGRSFATVLPLRAFDPPFDMPHVETSMLWHSRTQDEPARVWLRRLVTDASARMSEVGRRKRR